MKVSFIGTGRSSAFVLQELLASKHEVFSVYSGPRTRVSQMAAQNRIFTRVALTFRDYELEKMKVDAPDVIVVANARVLPEALFDIAPCLNIHPSDLPRWRGAKPIFHTLKAGDEKTAVCVVGLQKGEIDAGPVYARKEVKIKATENNFELDARLVGIGGKLVVDVLNNWGKIKPKPQAKRGITMAPRWTNEQAQQMRVLDFQDSAKNLHNLIRALSPWMGGFAAYYMDQEETKGWLELTILRSEVVRRPARKKKFQPGEIIYADQKHGLVVACGQGALRLKEFVCPGTPLVKDNEFLKKYHQFAVGETFQPIA